MVKRKQNASSELRASPIAISLQRYKELSVLQTTSKTYWGVEHLQPFFPPIECLFKTENLNFSHEYGIKFNQQISSILPSKTEVTVNGSTQKQKVHVKKTMLLSPFKWMQGDYGTSLGLPTTTEQAASIHSKLQNSNNAAYVGALAASVLSESGCQHFPKVYGVFTGVSQSHTIDISDDYEELCERPWFSQNLGKTFELKLVDRANDETMDFSHTRSARAIVQLGEETELGAVEVLETEHVESSMADLNMFSTELDETSTELSEDSSVSTSYIFNVESCDCDEDDEEIMNEEPESGDSFAWATFTNVPVQLTVMEQCTGTLYELMSKNQDTDKQIAWLSQVMFALAYAQRNFGFVHNDLHSNNVMYDPTDKEFLYYNLAGVLYKVPTYGYLIKVIDFERGVLSVRVTGMKDPKFFMSDHFSVNDEAGGQYNYPPFYIGKYAEVKPNPSFDLVRLATSLFWDFFPNGPACEEYAKNPIFLCFKKWLTFEDGTSVLFGKEDPRHDRYHGFTLYKAIARYCKDTAVPRKELLNLKSMYEITAVPLGEIALNIDA
jgi:hypothetical protein